MQDDFLKLIKLHKNYYDLQFLRKKIKTKKVVANLHDKKEHVTRIINLKQSLNHGLVLGKV